MHPLTELYPALLSLFREHSTFNVRWKKDRARDYAGPALRESEYLKRADTLGISRRETRQLLEAGVLHRTTYRLHRHGPVLACYVLTIAPLPQTQPIKKVTAAVQDTAQDLADAVRTLKDETVRDSLIQLALSWLCVVALTVLGIYAVYKLTRQQYDRIRSAAPTTGELAPAMAHARGAEACPHKSETARNLTSAPLGKP